MPTVVILLSDKRSGSTMLQDAVCGHEAVRHVAFSPHTYFETHHWLKSAVVLDQPARLFSGGRVYDGYGSAANARAYIAQTLTGNLPDYTPPKDDRALCFDGWEALCSEYAQPVFFEKSPQTLAHWAALDLMLEWISRTDLTVKVIGLVRNPHAVQYSAQALFASEPAQRQFGWLEIQRNLLTVKACLPEAQFRLVRYEDLVANPEDSLAALCDFIGIPPQAGLGAAIRGGSEEKWRQDPAYTLGLHASVRRMAGRFGYEARELDNPRAGAASPAGAAVPASRRLRLWGNRLRDRRVRPLVLRLKRYLRPG